MTRTTRPRLLAGRWRWDLDLNFATVVEVDQSVDSFDVGNELPHVGQDDASVEVWDDLRVTHHIPCMSVEIEGSIYELF